MRTLPWILTMVLPTACIQFPDSQLAWRAENLAEANLDGLDAAQVIERLGQLPLAVAADGNGFVFVASSVRGMPLYLGEMHAVRVVEFDPLTGRVTRSTTSWPEPFVEEEAVALLRRR